MKNLSTEWTDEERLSVIWALSIDLQESARVGLISREYVFNIAERLVVLSTFTAEFLEASRDKILRGVTVTE